MQKSITSQKIREKLGFLKIRLPKQPTAVNSLYSLPAEFAKVVIRSNFSQPSIQKISDHIGYFLGLLNSVQVTIGIESSEYMLAAAGDIKKADRVGLYKVLGGYNREIQITKKFRFKLEHILAILAHESTHHYLYHHGVRESEESENEILTELATAYLGLGHLLILGYKPITWTSDHWNYVFASGYTTHALSIGYVTPNIIRKAIILSAELRNWNPKEVTANFSSVWDKIIAYFQLWPYRNKLRKIEKEKKETAILVKKRDEQIDFLKMDVAEVNKSYNRVCELIKSISITTDPSSITAEDGRMLVEISNKISIGEPVFKTKSISEKISNLNASSAVNNEDITQLVNQVDELKNIISKWHKLLCKYSSSGATSANSG